MTRRGRSTILDLGAAAPARARAWVLRGLLVALVIGVVTALAVAVAQELMPEAGPALVIYQLHDMLWVPFWARIWVQNSVTSLIWFVPATVLVTLALIEFLGLAQPVRHLQTATLNLALRIGHGRWVLVLQQRLGWGHGFEAFLVLFIESDLICARNKAMEAIEAGHTTNADALGRAMIQRAYLRADDEATHAICAEALLLMRALGVIPDALGRWERTLGRILGPGAPHDLRLALQPDPAVIGTALDTLANPATPPQKLALLTLAHAGNHQGVTPVQMRAWFDLWAQLARTPEAGRRLAHAETMIDFEFWAAHAESAVTMTETAADRSGWLAALLPDVPMSRPLGEHAAAGLAPTGPRVRP